MKQNPAYRENICERANRMVIATIEAASSYEATPTERVTLRPPPIYVMTHETGHCLGLGDQKPEYDSNGFGHKNSVMWYTVYLDTAPHADNIDVDALLYLYGM